MSGPKTSSYQVEQNRLMEERARRRAWTDVADAEVAVRQLSDAIEKARQIHGVDLPSVTLSPPSRPADAASSHAVVQFSGALRLLIGQVTGQLEAGCVRARLTADTRALDERALAGLTFESSEDELASYDIAESKRRLAQTSPSVETRRAKRRARLQRILGSLRVSADSDALSLRAEECLTSADDTRTELLFNDLRLRVQRLNDEFRDRDRARVEAESMRSALLGLTGPDVERCLVELDEVAAGRRALDSALRETITVASERARQEVDREHTARVVHAALQEIGYEVEEGLHTALVNGGTIDIYKPGWRRHAVRLELSARGQRIDSRVVRLEASSDRPSEAKQRDTEIEQEWCGDFETVQSELANDGVRLDCLARMPPGKVPVPVLRKADRASSRARRTEQQNERES